MARQFAITIGVNHYRYFSERPLKFAAGDAVAMQRFLKQEDIGFQEVYLYADELHDAKQSHANLPERTNLLRALNRIAANLHLDEDDSFWFFFSGHGARRAEIDYLLPSDGDPENLQDTAIPIDRVIRSLRRCGAGNLILILDACRNRIPDYSRSVGSQTVELAKQEGIITLFSCSPGERSYELSDYRQGAFTHVLLKALQGEYSPNRCNAKQLSEYLRNQVPTLVKQFGQQTPYVVAEPIEKAVQILLPPAAVSPPPEPEVQPATPPPKIDKIKADALVAMHVKQDLDRAEQLWKHLNLVADNPEDRTLAVDMLQEITKKRHGPQTTTQPASSVPHNPAPTVKSSATKPNPQPPKRPAPAPPKRPEPQSQQKSWRQNTPEIVSGDPPRPEIQNPRNLSDEDLTSEKRGISYHKLCKLLDQKKWQEADWETADRMLEVAGRQSERYLRASDIENFPCKDLKIIDRLWIEASKGKFGFSVQNEIWQECGSPNVANKDWEKFCVTVGWRIKGVLGIGSDLVSYSKIAFDLEVPRGYLPRWGWVIACQIWGFKKLEDRPQGSDSIFRAITERYVSVVDPIFGSQDLFYRFKTCKV